MFTSASLAHRGGGRPRNPDFWVRAEPQPYQTIFQVGWLVNLTSQVSADESQELVVVLKATLTVLPQPYSIIVPDQLPRMAQQCVHSWQDVDPLCIFIVEAVQQKVVNIKTDLLVLKNFDFLLSCVDFQNDPEMGHQVAQVILKIFRDKANHQLSVIHKEALTKIPLVGIPTHPSWITGIKWVVNIWLPQPMQNLVFGSLVMSESSSKFNLRLTPDVSLRPKMVNEGFYHVE